MSAVLKNLLSWPSDLFCFNTLIALWIFLNWREAVVVHAKDYLTLMATGIKWTVYMVFSFVCLQKNIDAAKLSIVGLFVIAKLSLAFAVEGPCQIGFMLLDD